MNDIEDLQEKITYQEHTIEQLNDALSKQQQQISQLQEELLLLTQAIKVWREESRNGNVDNTDSGLVYEIPPHY